MSLRLDKYILLLIVVALSWSANGQITTSKVIFREDKIFMNSLDTVVSSNLFFSTMVGSSLTGTNATTGAIKSWWKQYDSATGLYSTLLKEDLAPSSTITTLSNKAGYEFSSTTGIDTTHAYCWVFEPKITLDSVSVSKDSLITTCTKLGLVAKTTVDSLYYYNPLDLSKKFPVNYLLTYHWIATPVGLDTITKVRNPLIDQPFVNSSYAVTVSSGLKLSVGPKSIDTIYVAKGLEAGIKIVPLGTHYENAMVQDTLMPYIVGAPFKVIFSNTSKGHFTDVGVSVTKIDQTEKYYYDYPFDETRSCIFEAGGVYNVEITISDGKRCTSSTVLDKAVKIQESAIGIPNAFTPNGDGANDVFEVSYVSLKTYHICIYNRWGRLVFESSNPGESWDGNESMGMADQGVYFYIITATDLSGNQLNEKDKTGPLKGYIHLLRDN